MNIQWKLSIKKVFIERCQLNDIHWVLSKLPETSKLEISSNVLIKTIDCSIHFFDGLRDSFGQVINVQCVNECDGHSTTVRQVNVILLDQMLALGSWIGKDGEINSLNQTVANHLEPKSVP